MTSHVGRLEARLFRGSWDDGLLDLFAGVASVAIGILWAFDLVVFGAIVPVMLVPFWQPVRRWIVEPRAGLVEFSEERTGRNRRWLTASVWTGLAALVSFSGLALLSEAWRDRLELLVAGLPALLLGVLAAFAAGIAGAIRFFAYAAAFCVAGLVVALADTRPEVGIIAGGVVVLANGSRLLMRFLRIPVSEEGVE